MKITQVVSLLSRNKNCYQLPKPLRRITTSMIPILLAEKTKKMTERHLPSSLSSQVKLLQRKFSMLSSLPLSEKSKIRNLSRKRLPGLMLC